MLVDETLSGDRAAPTSPRLRMVQSPCRGRQAQLLSSGADHEPTPAGTRAAIEEQLRLGQELRQRANQGDQAASGKGEGGSSTEASDEGGSEGDDDEDGDKAAAEGPQSGRSRQQAKTRAAALDILQGVLLDGQALLVAATPWASPGLHA